MYLFKNLSSFQTVHFNYIHLFSHLLSIFLLYTSLALPLNETVIEFYMHGDICKCCNVYTLTVLKLRPDCEAVWSPRRYLEKKMGGDFRNENGDNKLFEAKAPSSMCLCSIQHNIALIMPRPLESCYCTWQHQIILFINYNFPLFSFLAMNVFNLLST